MSNPPCVLNCHFQLVLSHQFYFPLRSVNAAHLLTYAEEQTQLSKLFYLFITIYIYLYASSNFVTAKKQFDHQNANQPLQEEHL
jgi:hypothetical protein